MSELSRRTFVRSGAVFGGALVISGSAGATWAATRDPRRVYVLVLDGCDPHEISREQTPNLHRLRREGRWFPNARSTPIAETLPNHLAMMTGVLPDRSGVPANTVYDRASGAERTVELPSDIASPTILKRLQGLGVTTGSVLSKDYLYSLFNGQATYQWEPKPLLPVTGHAPDTFTMAALQYMIRVSDPNVVFANFGNIDRFGHADFTGSDLQVLRRAALAEADTVIGGFVAWLKLRGLWSRSTVMVLADHSMDWSRPGRYINLTAAFAADPLVAGRIGISDNGGAELLTWIGPAAERAVGLERARRLALATAGVLSVRTTSELRLGAKAGDLVALCRAGWRFSDPKVYSNPIPGNHGHPATEPIPFFVTGGAVTQGVSSRRVTTRDVAPTVATIFGLGAPDGGWDGAKVL